MNNYTFKTKPYQHQIECLMFGVENPKFLLADQQGLGKTKEVIDLACYLKQEKHYKHCLIVCGVNGLKWNWKEEVLIHSDEKAHILGERTARNGNVRIKGLEEKLEDLDNLDDLPYFIITNIESLRLKRKTGKKIKKRSMGKVRYVDEYVYPLSDKLCTLCAAGEIPFIAADECHKMKNPESEQGIQFLRLQSENEVAMTGTPMMNSPLDLFIILKWLGIEDHSFWQFKSHFCILGGYGGREVVGYKNKHQLQKILDNIMLRRRKEDVLDLPDKVYLTEYVEMGPEQEKVYKAIHKETESIIDLITQSVNPLSMLTRLRQATGYTGVLSSTVKCSAKMDRLSSLVDEIVENGEKAIVFSNWTSMTDEIINRLSEYNPLCITGETKDEERQQIVKNFQEGDCKVIVGTIGAMGTGLTLTAASNVIFLDEPWNRALREQAEDRAHRIGQKETVNIYFLLTKGTIDERIHSIVEEKGELSDEIVDKAELVNYLLS